MATASYSVDTSYHHQRRDSASSKSSRSGRRPRLLRSYATEPSITTENACKGVMTSPTYSTRRATELLNRVAISSSNHTSPSVQSSRSSVLESERMAQTSHGSCSYFPLLRTRSVSISSGSEADSEAADSACYFSFPSFDTWDEERAQDEKKTMEGS